MSTEEETNKQRISKKLITLTAEELERAKKLAASSTTSKTSQKNPFTKKLIKNPRKSATQQSPHRARSRADAPHDPLEELLGDKLAEIYCQKDRYKNNMTPMCRNTNTSKHTIGNENKKKLHNASMIQSQNRVKSVGKKKIPAKTSKNTNSANKSMLLQSYAAAELKKEKKHMQQSTYSKSYYNTNNSLNLYNLLKHDLSQSPGSSSLNITKIVDEPTKSSNLHQKPKKPQQNIVSKKIDLDKKLIVTANNSYIHNLNITPDGISYMDDKKVSPIVESKENSQAKKTEKLIHAIEIELNKRCEGANSYEGYEKHIKLMDAHKEALENIISMEGGYSDLLEKIKNAYDNFIEETIRKHDDEIDLLKKELEKEYNQKTAKLEKELREKDKQIEELRKAKNISPKKEKIKNVPKLDLAKVQKISHLMDSPSNNNQQQINNNDQIQDENSSDALSFSNNNNKLQQENEAIEKDSCKNPLQIKPKGIPLLDFTKMPQSQGYHDEFMAKECEFSPSWREKLAKEKRF